MTFDADALLSGPRGRRLCLEVAQRGPHGSLLDDVRLAILEASHQLYGAGGWSVLRAGSASGRARPGAEVSPRSTPSQIAALIARRPATVPGAVALSDALDLAVAFAWYWQEPSGEDLLAADQDVRAALRAVAEAVVAAPGTVWWTSPVDLSDQWVVQGGLPSGTAPDADDGTAPERTGEPAPAPALAGWWRRIELGKQTEPVTSGVWWSGPSLGVLRSTRRWAAGLHPGHERYDQESTGPLGLTFVEDTPGWEDVVATRLAVDPGARVLEVDGPDVWADLCRRYPSPVFTSPDWHRATGRDGRWLVPDWDAVARDVDAVHLTVAGYLTTAGRVVEVGDGVASVLAGWSPDETSWFRGAQVDVGSEQRWHLDREIGWVRTDLSAPDRD